MSADTQHQTLPATETVVLHVGRQYRASEKAVVESALWRRPGILWVEANPVAQTATVRYDVATAITIGRGTRQKMYQNLAWATGYNSLAIPIAAGIFEPLGFTLSPAIGALSMSGSSITVAINAIALRRLRLPGQPE